jgi:tetratricopeptide (TPR) repeat protein
VRRPGDLPLLADRAAIRFGMQAWDSLRADADRLLAADSLLAMGYYYRAYANWMTDRARKRATILRDLDRSLAYRPSLTGALSMKHWVLLDSAPDEALRLVEQAIRIEPGLHYAYMQLAIEQYHRGDFAGARRSSEAALMLKRDTTSYYDTRAAAEQRLGMSKSEVFRRLAAGYRDVAQVLEQEGERERAIAAYVASQTALRNNVPGTSYAEELKDTHARLAALGEDATHFASAWALIGRKQYAQALAADDSAIRIRPGYGLYYRTRATIDSLLGRRVDAAHDLVNAADVRLAHGDADGATQGYFAALTMLLVPRSPADTLRSAEDVAPIMVKVSKVVERKFGRDSVPVFYRARLADATWPAGWSPQSRDKLRQAIQAELARVSGAVASDGRAVSTPR